MKIGIYAYGDKDIAKRGAKLKEALKDHTVIAYVNAPMLPKKLNGIVSRIEISKNRFANIEHLKNDMRRQKFDVVVIDTHPFGQANMLKGCKCGQDTKMVFLAKTGTSTEDVPFNEVLYFESDVDAVSKLTAYINPDIEAVSPKVTKKQKAKKEDGHVYKDTVTRAGNGVSTPG